MVWLTITNPDPVQDSIDIPFVCTENYNDYVHGAKSGHTYKLLIHIDKVEDYSFSSRSGEHQARSFEWWLGVPDGVDDRVPPRGNRQCNQHERSSRRRDHDEDEDRDHDDGHPRRRQARSIWARIGCRDEYDALSPVARGHSIAGDSDGHRHRATRMPVSSDLKETQILPLDAEPQVNVDASADDFHSKLEDFLAEVSTSLPQPLLPVPPKKLASLFKKPISPATVRAIRELVSFDGGQALLQGGDKNDGAA
ncbi:hypothetical protein ABZP36_032025 [Zizania latifolia]